MMENSQLYITTNPPYMGSGGMSDGLNSYVRKYFKDSKSDLFAVFIEKCSMMTKINGFQAMISMQTWMFISSYGELRYKVLEKNIISLLQFGIKAFEEIGNDVVQTAAYIVRNTCLNAYDSTYFRLLNHDRSIKESDFLNRNNVYYSKSKEFEIIPGKPLAYWISDKLKETFKKPLVSSQAKTVRGYATASSDKYMRKWYEVDVNNIMFSSRCNKDAYESGKKWFPYNKGGFYKKWYGNNEEIINYQRNGEDFRSIKGFCFSNQDYYFRESITWTKVCTGRISLRYNKGGFIFGDAGPALIANSHKELYTNIALLNSKLAEILLNVINPTLNYTNEAVGNIPMYCKPDYIEELCDLVQKCIDIMKNDWDSYETSWDYQKNSLIGHKGKISNIYQEHVNSVNDDIENLRKYENRINNIFINSFDLENDFDAVLEERDICVKRLEIKQDIKYLISYAVGCMFGRYSLDKDGLQCTNANIDKDNYTYFVPDSDNIIPIMDEEYFNDDIVGRFIEFIKKAFGEKDLEENISFIVNALGIKENNSRRALREYFLKYFYSDHCSIYTTFGTGKRPIYWMFNSGGENGFKALIYIHRYDRDTIGRIRTDYLHKAQNAIEGALKNAEYIISSSTSAVDRAKATKDRDKYIKQLSEIKIYDQALAHVALQRKEIDLDDGVKHNYQLFQGVEVSSEGSKKQSVDLLAKI